MGRSIEASDLHLLAGREVTMSRVERTENPSERRGSEQSRQAERGRGSEKRENPNPGHTPGKAEGEEREADEALRRDR
jgi:hypothetical protein